MRTDFLKSVSLFEDEAKVGINCFDVSRFGIVKIVYDVNIFSWGTTRGGAGIPFSDKIPASFYNLITYNDNQRDYFYKDKKICCIYLSSDRKKAFIDCQNDQMHDYEKITYLVDVSTGEILFSSNLNFSSSCSVVYKDNLYLCMYTEDGVIIFNDKFNDALHENSYRIVRGALYSKCFIYNFYKGVFQIFDLEKNLLYKTSYVPCDVTNYKTQTAFFEQGLLLTSKDEQLTLVDLKNDTIIEQGFHLNRDLKKPGDIVYDKNLNIVSLDRNCSREESGIKVKYFITEGNDIRDLKIYVDWNDKIRLAEIKDIPLEGDIKYVYDYEQGLKLVDKGKKVDRNSDYDLVSFGSMNLNKIKVGFENGSFNVYEKGKGWLYNDDIDDGMI